MKKIAANFLSALVAAVMLQTTAYAQLEDAVAAQARAGAYSYLCGLVFQREAPEYANPRYLIIAQPCAGTKTHAAKASILGACDAEYPLYMDGVEIPVTPRGFFTRYVDLEYGDNTFTFKNKGVVKTVTIIRTEAPDPPAPAADKPLASPMYGVVNREYATHRAKPDEDVNLLTPPAKGASFNILGKAGSYYKTEAGTYIYASDVDAYGGELPPNTVHGVAASREGNITYVEYSMDINALYEISRDENKATVTLRAKRDESGEPDLTGTDIVQAEKTVGEGSVTWEFTFSEPSRPIGHFVTFNDRKMTVGFRHTGEPAPETLLGMRVVLDAGHGGEDPGAMGPPGGRGPVEKDFNIYVTLSAAQYLASRGADTRLIRRDDTFVPLKGRVEAILGAAPDISVSIHTNAMPISRDYGASSGPLMFYTFDTSLDAASRIHKYVTEALGAEYTPPIKQNFALCRITNCPAVLFEMSFMSNPGDYERLLNADALESIGQAVGKGIEEYLLDGHTRPAPLRREVIPKRMSYAP